MTYRDLWSLAEARATTDPDRVALDFDDQRWAWAELTRAAEALAAGLASEGVQRGDVVCTFAPNAAEVVVTILALVRLGAIEVPVNAGLKGDQLEHVLAHSGATALIVDGSLGERLPQDLARATGVRLIVQRGDGPMPADVRIAAYDEVRAAGGPPPPFEMPLPGDPMNIVYTSGTTGPAKGAVLPHGYVWEQATIKIEQWGLSSDDVLFTALPLYHVNARFSTFCTSVVAGASAAIVSSFSASQFWDQVRRTGATEVGAVGAISSILMLQEPHPRERDHRVRMMHGATGIPMSRRAEFEERFGLRIVTGFAMTECGHIATTSPDDPRRWQASGKAVPQFEIDIVDDGDEPVGRGHAGELVVRPRRPWVMFSGYHNEPAITQRAVTNLWFHTGDLAMVDDDGYLHWLDRKKDAIRRRGEMISSSEVERIVLEHPSVAECAAVGVAAELGEEEIKLVVVARSGHELDPHELVGFCRERLPDFAAPRYVELLAELPKGATHKVEKTKLRGLQPTVVDTSTDRR